MTPRQLTPRQPLSKFINRTFGSK
jgi:hypothetical protein